MTLSKEGREKLRDRLVADFFTRTATRYEIDCDQPGSLLTIERGNYMPDASHHENWGIFLYVDMGRDNKSGEKKIFTWAFSESSQGHMMWVRTGPEGNEVPDHCQVDFEDLGEALEKVLAIADGFAEIAWPKIPGA